MNIMYVDVEVDVCICVCILCVQVYTSKICMHMYIYMTVICMYTYIQTYINFEKWCIDVHKHVKYVKNVKGWTKMYKHRYVLCGWVYDGCAATKCHNERQSSMQCGRRLY